MPGQAYLRANQQNSQDPAKAPSNPLLEEYLKKKPSGVPKLMRGQLAPSSIFEQDRRKDESDGQALEKPAANNEVKPVRDPSATSNVLDPDPINRLRWERKKVIQSIRHRGRVSRTLMLQRTERSSLSKSHNIKTSVKKLAPLARQITGKSIEDAISQMHLSRKKAAVEAAAHLEHARNMAVVSRGMGLGEAEGTKGAPVAILTKEGKKKLVADRTAMYIDQAWVGRGPYGAASDHRARGIINKLSLPSTSLSVVVKEEATRIRQHEEREEKKRNRRVWVPLPDRPVTGQQPYYSW